MLYTGTGDDGKTTLFGCDQRLSKSSKVAEALGNLDELNSFLGVCKMAMLEDNIGLEVLDKKVSYTDIVAGLQQDLFVLQAETAGADKKIDTDRVVKLETLIESASALLPKIETFLVAGGSELSARLDYARAIARRAERSLVAVKEEGVVSIGDGSLAYSNRLSSLLYVLARLANAKLGVIEETPKY